jgi:hypothetical protein
VSANNTITKTDPPAADPNTVVVYPNPMQTQLTIYLKNFQTGNLSMVLYNTKGQLLWKDEIPNFNGSNLLTVPVSVLPGGVYWLSIRSGKDIRIIKKLLK